MTLKDALGTIKQITGKAKGSKGLMPMYEAVKISTDGVLHAFNGMIGASIACTDVQGLPDTVTPVDGLVRAINATTDEDREIMASDEHLVVIGTKKKVKIKLPTLPVDQFPTMTLDTKASETVAIKDGDAFLGALGMLAAFGLEHVESKQAFLMSICCIDGWLYASDIHTGVRINSEPIFTSKPQDFHLPIAFAHILMTYGVAPSHFDVRENHVTAAYADGSSILSLRHSHSIPPYKKLFDHNPTGSCVVIPGALREAVTLAAKFGTEIAFKGGKLITFNTNGGDEVTVDGFNDIPDSAYNAKQLARTLEFAKEIDMTRYPNPVPWKAGEGVQGLLMGIRV